MLNLERSFSDCPVWLNEIKHHIVGSEEQKIKERKQQTKFSAVICVNFYFKIIRNQSINEYLNM